MINKINTQMKKQTQSETTMWLIDATLAITLRNVVTKIDICVDKY